MNHNQPEYLSFLIRMWRVKGKQGWRWRASLENPADGKLYQFPTLDRLIAFLRAQTEDTEYDGQEKETDREFTQ